MVRGFCLRAGIPPSERPALFVRRLDFGRVNSRSRAGINTVRGKLAVAPERRTMTTCCDWWLLRYAGATVWHLIL